LQLRKRGYKKAVIIKNRPNAMKEAGFIWRGPDNILRQMGSDGKVKKF
jgi:hypothetical protein